MREYRIKPLKGFSSFKLGEVFQFRDLLLELIRRDLFKPYKQSILGPLWFFIQPIFSSLVFTVIFGRVAGLSTDGTPAFIFYLCGSMCWNFFSTTFTSTSNTFISNQNLFGKVYFPRLISPLSSVAVNIVRFFVQLIILTAVWLYYVFIVGIDFNANPLSILLVIGVLFVLSIQALSFGLIVSALTAKYRDLKYALGFITQIWMFTTPVIYPLSMVPQKYQKLAAINPLTPVFETFRYAILGNATISMTQSIISLTATLTITLLGLLLFTRVERNFMDTV
jgi:lipopolysaccharide transport system permease protein